MRAEKSAGAFDKIWNAAVGWQTLPMIALSLGLDCFAFNPWIRYGSAIFACALRVSMGLVRACPPHSSRIAWIASG